MPESIRRVRIRAAGISISALRADKAPIVYLHPLNFDAWTFEPLLRQVGGSALDLRGHGRSSSPAGGYWLGALATDVGTVLASLFSTPAVVIGQSLGARVALGVAASFPWAVERLVLIEGGADLEPNVQRTLERRMTTFPDSYPSRAQALQAFADTHPQLPPSAQEAIVRRNFTKGRWRNPRAARVAIVRSWNMVRESLASQVRAKTLIVRGTASDHWAEAHAAHFAAQFPEGATLAAMDGGHYLLQESPGVLLDLIRRHDFL